MRLLAGVLAAMGLLVGAAAAEDPPLTAASLAEPTDGAMIPRPGLDPPCSPEGWCNKALARGRVAQGYWPFLAVRPEVTNPRFWIQRPILEVAPDGTFESLAYLGNAEDGIGEQFEVFVIAHRDPARFAAWEILFDVPPECVPAGEARSTAFCVVSPFVTVTRTR